MRRRNLPGVRHCAAWELPQPLAAAGGLRLPSAMDDVARLPGTRLAAYMAAHPDTDICCVEGTWHAWLPAPGGGGAECYGRDEDELLAKLAVS